jgi:predicted RNA-binding Zn-ribbon protein involved in translation (DUF1610 family)
MADYSAQFKCPGCGSPLETLEGTISLQCRFCGLIMRIGSPDRILKYFYKPKLDGFAVKFSIEKYLKEKGLSLSYSELSRQLYYIPFYRFRGMSYALYCEKTVEIEDDDPEYAIPNVKRELQRKCSHFDLTVPAYTNESFGLQSLGIRPEVMPLTALQNDNFPEDSIKIDIKIPPEEAKQEAMAMFFMNIGFSSLNKEVLSSEMIGEGLSVIYYPVWAFTLNQGDFTTTMFIDGLNKRVYHEIPGELKTNSRGSDLSRASEINPVQHKCPNCGFDLPISEYSLFYYCRNCFRAYMINNDNYVATELRTAKYEEGKYYHPFWRFAFAIGDDIKTVAKFSKILTGEIPLVARKKAQNDFYLYVPGFKSKNLNSLTNVGTRICCVQPVLEIENRNVPFEAEMVLPESEALELARHYWNVVKSKYRHLEKPQYQFEDCKTSQGEIVWLSLSRPHYDTRPRYFNQAKLYAK